MASLLVRDKDRRELALHRHAVYTSHDAISSIVSHHAQYMTAQASTRLHIQRCTPPKHPASTHPKDLALDVGLHDLVEDEVGQAVGHGRVALQPRDEEGAFDVDVVLGRGDQVLVGLQDASLESG